MKLPIPNRLRRIMVANMIALPSMTVNYSVLIVLIDVVHFNGFWVLSGVFVCDLIGLAVNGYLVDFSTKTAMRFQSFWELVDKQEVKRLLQEKEIIDKQIDDVLAIRWSQGDMSTALLGLDTALKFRIHKALDEELRPKKKVPIVAHV